MRPPSRVDVANVGVIARREFVARASTRTFLVSTLVLVLAAAAVGLAPVAVSYFNPDSTRVAVYVGAADLQGDPVATLEALLNPPADQDGTTDPGPGGKPFVVRRSTDLEADRRLVLDGALSALLDIERDADGEMTFTVYTRDPTDGATAQLGRQAATSIAIADRAARSGLSPSDLAGLLRPPQVAVRSPDPSKPAATSQATTQELADSAATLAVLMFLLIAILLYGTWVAQSVVEEKSSRMMEIILTAASPFQLLAGKVLGVSAAALLQFVAVLGAVLVALLAEDQVGSIVLGESARLDLPSAVTPSLLVAFSVFFILGFLLYAALFAAAGSLVSRHEDVSQIVTPMTLVASAGSAIAMYAAIGSLDPSAAWVVALSWVPFLSPYMMVGRLSAGDVGLLEVGVVVALLVATIVLAVWVASRIYAAGVLRYGQAPSVRGLWQAVREGR